MIKKFFRVNDSLFRGAAPTQQDVENLKKKFNVNRIVSLDSNVAKDIDDACKKFNIEHITIGIDASSKSSIMKLFNYDIISLLTQNPNIFIHCLHGKDRTGLAIALFRCKHDNWDCEKAIQEAKAFGFGTGLSDKIISLYTKLIQQACQKHSHEILDNNDFPQVGLTNNPTGLKGNLGIVDNDGGFLFEGFLNG